MRAAFWRFSFSTCGRSQSLATFEPLAGLEPLTQVFGYGVNEALHGGFGEATARNGIERATDDPSGGV